MRNAEIRAALQENLDTGGRLAACTKGHYMREIYEAVMPS